MGRRAGTKQWAMRPTGGPSRWPLVALAAGALGWGILISGLAGAAAGTMIVPVLGTIYGGMLGLLIGIVPTLLGTVSVAVLAARHRPLVDPPAFHRELRTLFGFIRAVLMLVGMIVVGAFAGSVDTDGSLLGSLGVLLWIGVGPYVAATLVVTFMLRTAGDSLMQTFVRRSGWAVHEAWPLGPGGSPEPGDSQVGGPVGRGFPEGAS